MSEEGPAAAALRLIRGAAQRGSDILQQLLAFGRRSPLPSRPVGVSAVVRDSEAMLRRTVGEDIVLSVRLDAAADGVYAPPGTIQQVLVNLVLNARAALGPGGELTISTDNVSQAEDDLAASGDSGSAEFVRLVVSDNGCGMDAETRARVINPLLAGHPAPGGHGLPTASALVSQLGGRLDVESEVGAGTTVTVLLPRFERHETAPADAAHGAVLPPGTRVLVLEDDPLVRMSVEHYLQEAGCVTEAVGLPSEARDLVEVAGERFDALVTDVRLPSANGEHEARRLAASNPGLAVVYMSALPAAVLIEQGRLSAGLPLLEKPFTAGQLTSWLAAVLPD